MVFYAVTLAIIFTTGLLNGLQITNTTPPINLTNNFFTDELTPYIYQIITGSMTYYIDPSDTTNTKHLSIGIYGKLNVK